MLSVLVVDDDIQWRNALCKMYTDLGANAIPAPDAKEAFRHMSNKIDLLSLDLNLGGNPGSVQGQAVLEKAATGKKCGAVVVITALVQDTKISDKRQTHSGILSYLKHYFPQRSHFLQKNYDLKNPGDINYNINHFKDSLMAIDWKRLCNKVNRIEIFNDLASVHKVKKQVYLTYVINDKDNLPMVKSLKLSPKFGALVYHIVEAYDRNPRLPLTEDQMIEILRDYPSGTRADKSNRSLSFIGVQVEALEKFIRDGFRREFGEDSLNPSRDFIVRDKKGFDRKRNEDVWVTRYDQEPNDQEPK